MFSWNGSKKPLNYPHRSRALGNLEQPTRHLERLVLGCGLYLLCAPSAVMPLNEAGSEVPGHNASKEVVLTMPDDQNDSSHHYRPAASASSTALARGSSSRAGNATPRARSLARSLAPDIATRDRARGATQRRRSTTGGGGFERAARTPLAPASRAAAAAQRTHDRGGRRVANAWGQPESDFQRASFRASCASGTCQWT